MDCVESAAKLGARDAYLVYRRSFAQMPAEEEERLAALRLGVHFLMLNQPVGYASDKAGHVTGVKLLRTRLGDPDASGRRKPAEVKGSEWTLDAQLVIEAIGNRPDADRLVGAGEDGSRRACGHGRENRKDLRGFRVCRRGHRARAVAWSSKLCRTASVRPGPSGRRWRKGGRQWQRYEVAVRLRRCPRSFREILRREVSQPVSPLLLAGFQQRGDGGEGLRAGLGRGLLQDPELGPDPDHPSFPAHERLPVRGQAAGRPAERRADLRPAAEGQPRRLPVPQEEVPGPARSSRASWASPTTSGPTSQRRRRTTAPTCWS